MARFGAAVLCAIALLFPTGVVAAQPPDAFEYRVLLNTDLDPATGCGVPVKDANIDTTVAGVESLVIMHVQRTSPQAAQVVGVGVRTCTAGSFGPEVAVSPGDWPVGLNNGLNGADVVEGFASRNALGNPDGLGQVVFSSTKTGFSDVLLTTNGQVGASPLFFRFASTAPAPALGAWAIGLVILIFSLIAYVTLRRYPRLIRLGVVTLILAIGGIVVAQEANIIPDGAVSDWGAIPPVGTDAINDSSAADDAEDIVAAFMAQDSRNVYFRFDLLNIIDGAAPRTATATVPPVGPMQTGTSTASSTPTPTASASASQTATGTATATPVDCSQVPDGTPCNDGNACTSGETCQAGSCGAGSPVVCLPIISLPGVTSCRSGTGTCNTTTGQCEYPPINNGLACDDGQKCNVGETCQNGQCTGGSVVFCIPTLSAPSCRQNATLCSPETGQCINAQAVDGTGCDDGNACTSGDTCTAGVCGGSQCGPGLTCCSPSAPCTDRFTDSANCGSCGNACVDSVCFQGNCFNGCVIAGVAYTNGTLNPANDCQVCDVTKSRTQWTGLGEFFPNPPQSTCKEGCFSGFCSRGDCVVISGIPNGGACSAPSSCVAANCNVNGVCVQTAVNEGGACTPSLSTNPCVSVTTGTCHSGGCVPAPANENALCVPPNPGSSTECRSSANGHCTAGTCQIDAIFGPCHPDPTNLCKQGQCGGEFVGFNLVPTGLCIDQGTTKQCTVPAGCGPAGTCNPATGQCSDGGPHPSFGAIDCGELGDVHPENCCPNQGCICPPAGNEFNSVCFFYECWTQGDAPGPAGAP